MRNALLPALCLTLLSACEKSKVEKSGGDAAAPGGDALAADAPAVAEPGEDLTAAPDAVDHDMAPTPDTSLPEPDTAQPTDTPVATADAPVSPDISVAGTDTVPVADTPVAWPDTPQSTDATPTGVDSAAADSIPGAETSVPGPDSGVSIQCFGAASTSFPSFSKDCADAGDCVLAFHQINCCGTMVVWGIAASEKAAFDQAESICESQYPGCGCAQWATTAEDGNSGWGPDEFGVECTEGKCSSHVK